MRPDPSVELPPARYQQLTDSERRQYDADAFFTKPVSEQRMRRLLREELEIRSAVRDAASIDASADALHLDRLSYALNATKLQFTMLRRYLRTEKGRQTIEEVRIDSIARTLRGKEPYDLARETVRRVLPAVRALVRSDIQQRFHEHRPIASNTARGSDARLRGLVR